MKRVTLILLTLALLLGGVGQGKAGMIDTASGWNGVSNIDSLGAGATATYGQTFTAAAALGTQLDSFSFWLASSYSGSSSHFSAYVMAWDGNKAAGPVLYSSDPGVLPTSTSYTEFSFDTGGVSLNTGSQYVAFLSVSEYYDGTTKARMGIFNGGTAYTDGAMVFSSNGNDFSSLTSDPWIPSGGDAAFKAAFSSPAPAPAPALAPAPAHAPEPSSLALFGMMTVTAVGYLRRRGKQAGAA